MMGETPAAFLFFLASVAGYSVPDDGSRGLSANTTAEIHTSLDSSEGEPYPHSLRRPHTFPGSANRFSHT